MTLTAPGLVLAYSPDLLTKDDLVRGFVARQPLLDRILDDLRRESGAGAPQHALVLGQHGTGKTTLLRRLAYAINDDPELHARWQPVTFPEEQYNVTDLTSFWSNCVAALGDTLDRQGNMSFTEELDSKLAKMPADPVAHRQAALKLLTDTSANLNKRLLLLVDNIDLVLDRIGKDQEWELRRALQEEERLLLIGASSRALEQTYEYGRAFYDFFRIQELGALTDDETLAVLKALAKQHAAVTIEQTLEQNPGRIRAMRLLTGGNPRTIVLLFKVLSQGPNGNLETDLQQLLDQYTPLYKARLEDLPSQAQLLVDAIAVHWDPITAGDLAAKAGIGVNTVSAQLQRLEGLGVIEKTPWFGEKKNAFQIAERLFNIWYLMRASRRVRRRLISLVRFLEIWFDEQQHRNRARAHPAAAPELIGRRPAEAAQMYLQALQIDASSESALNGLQNVCHQLAATPDERATAQCLARQGLELLPNATGLQSALAHALVANNDWYQAAPLVEAWAAGTNSWSEGCELFRALVETGHTKDALQSLQKAGADRRMEPLYIALRAVEAGTVDYLRRVAPEVRVPALDILAHIAPQITGGRTHDANPEGGSPITNNDR